MREKIIEKNLLNKKYRHLIIKDIIGRNEYGQLIVLVSCECGKEKKMLYNNIKCNVVKSCGCIRNSTHKLSKIIEYKTWANILQKCYNKKHNSFKYYGGKGIKVCDDWKNSFEKFYKDMGDRPKDCSLDRINTNGDYCPYNCRWADAFIQNVNKNIVIKSLKTKYKDIYEILKNKKIIIS